jgi:hypothetical protein
MSVPKPKFKRGTDGWYRSVDGRASIHCKTTKQNFSWPWILRWDGEHQQYARTLTQARGFYHAELVKEAAHAEEQSRLCDAHPRGDRLNTSPEAVALRQAAKAWADHCTFETEDDEDRKGGQLNRELLRAARRYAAAVVEREAGAFPVGADDAGHDLALHILRTR